jgi:hypothetical protein
MITNSNDGDVVGPAFGGMWILKLLDINSNIIAGKNYYDFNNNQIFDAGDVPVFNGKVEESTTGNITFTNTDGYARDSRTVVSPIK